MQKQRRAWIRAIAGLSVYAIGVGASIEVGAHTPYKQWTVYRRKHLLLGCHKDEPETYELAKQLTEKLKHHLPDASARVARAPNAQRLASLMATDQLDSAILRRSVAERMAAGEDEFAPYGRIDIRRLKQLDQYWLICRKDIPDRHAYLIAQALASEEGKGSSIQEVTEAAEANQDTHNQDTRSSIAWHRGVLRLRAGEEL